MAGAQILRGRPGRRRRICTPANDNAQPIQYDGLEAWLQVTSFGKEQLMKKLFLVTAAAATMIAAGFAQGGPGGGRGPIASGQTAQNCPNPNCPRRVNCPNRDNCPNPNCPRKAQKPPAPPAK
jgi:hypothetical protein